MYREYYQARRLFPESSQCHAVAQIFITTLTGIYGADCVRAFGKIATDPKW